MGVEYSGRREGAAVNIFAIHKKIALLRARLLESGEKYGLLAPQTVLLSQELDRLVVLVQKKLKSERGALVFECVLCGMVGLFRDIVFILRA